MTESFPATVALASPLLVWSATRRRGDRWPDSARLAAKVFAVVVATILLTRFGDLPALGWLDVALF